MQIDTTRQSRDQVRCLACHALYELPLTVGARDAPACPDCGAIVWVAATIPVPESEHAVGA